MLELRVLGLVTDRDGGWIPTAEYPSLCVLVAVGVKGDGEFENVPEKELEAAAVLVFARST